MVMEPVLKLHIKSEVNASTVLPKINPKKASSVVKKSIDEDSEDSTTNVD